MTAFLVICAVTATLISYACCVVAGQADDLAERQWENRPCG